MILASQSWKKDIETLLETAKQIPLLGEPPAFPWESLNENLKARLACPDFHVEPRRTDWIASGEWREGLGAKPHIIAIEATALKGRLFWATSSEEMREVTMALLTASGQINVNSRETPLSFFKGFYRFLSLEVLDSLAELDAFPGLHFTLAEQEMIPDEPLLSIEMTLSTKGVKSFAKLLMPRQTLGFFREFFRTEGRKELSSTQAGRIDVVLSLVIGESTLKHAAWKEISVGDLLLLDRCNYQPNQKSGVANLELEGKPIALCSLKEHSIEVLDYQNYEEDPVKYDDDESEEDFSSFELPDDNDEDTNDDETSDDENQDEDTFDEENLDENYDTETQDEGMEDEQFVEEEYGKELTAEDKTQEPIKTTQEAPSLTKELLITLSVEVTRIKMSLDKVLQLRPGNILELASSPEQGVTLTVGGKAVARGELIQLGEMLGVKITQLG